MPDYELKAHVLSCGMYDKFKKLEKDIWFNSENPLFEHELIQYRNYIEETYSEEYKECQRIWHADHKRRQRLSRKIRDMITSNECTFITLTFRDDVLQNTNERTRRRYVTRFLKTQSQRYLANIDFGDAKGREHYHGIICGRLDLHAWSYGYSYAETIRSVDDVSRISMYVTKLTNHAIKETTRRQTMIYSKDTFKIDAREQHELNAIKRLEWRPANDSPFT